MLALAPPPCSLQEYIGKATTCHTERRKTTREGIERGIPYGLLTDGVTEPVYISIKPVEYCAGFDDFITECFYIA
jgi:hypothetical protein